MEVFKTILKVIWGIAWRLFAVLFVIVSFLIGLGFAFLEGCFPVFLFFL